MSNVGGFLEVIRVLQTVSLCMSSDSGPRAEKVVGLMEFIHYFSDLGLQTTHFRYIYARMCVFASKCV